MVWVQPSGGQTTQTRRAPSSHNVWEPLPYMRRASQFLQSHYVAGLPLKPGGRKTSITLDAFIRLKEAGQAETMLVIAPLRVCRQTWRQEAKKWTQFKDVSFALLHGSKKDEALRSGASVYLINPEGIAWLCQKYFGRRLPFDIVCIDELTKFQNASADRSKALQPRLGGVRYRWGLTGSLFAKGHMSIFGQQKILDDGAALGRYITHYRDKYFQCGFDGFTYDLLPGAERRITEQLAPYWFYMDDRDYSELPPLVDVPRVAEMSKPERKLYDQMRTKMLADLPDGRVTAANAGACYSKLAQMANGAIYNENRDVFHIHDLKIDMLDELFDELDGEPLLVGYEFNHDLDRIREWYRKKTGDELPYLGKGTTHKQEDQWVRDWNLRRLPLLLAHPQSAGHGLNMQEGQAYNVAWFSVTWDWELYDQFIRRVRRSGNDNARIFNHILTIKGTLDELKLAAIKEKDFTERGLIVALNNQILSEEAQGQQQPTINGDIRMVAKLSRPSTGTGQGGGQQQERQTEATRDAPGGGSWARAAGGGGGNASEGQRERIQSNISPDRSGDAQQGFSGSTGAAQREFENNDYGATGEVDRSQNDAPKGNGWARPAGGTDTPFEGGTVAAEKPKRTRSTKTAEPATELVAVSTGLTFDEELQLVNTREEGLNARHNEMVRVTLMCALLHAAPDAEEADLVASAQTLMDFVERG